MGSPDAVERRAYRVLASLRTATTGGAELARLELRKRRLRSGVALLGKSQTFES
jgi:hypothetical protein